MQKTTFYKNNKNNNYTLAYSKQAYINNYSMQQYKHIQQLFNTQCSLQTIIHCVVNNNEDCYTSNLFVVQYKNKYYMCLANAQTNSYTTNIVQLNCKKLKQVNNIVLATMQTLFN